MAEARRMTSLVFLRRHILRVCLAPLLASACLKVPQQSASLAAMDASEVTASELQLRVYEAGRRLSSIVETTADTIAAHSANPVVRRNALQWKIAAVPLIEEASLRPDPVVATADLWGFTIQLSDYVTQGDGREAFGDQQQLAVAATDSLKQVMGDVAGHVVGTDGTRLGTAEQRIRDWAALHPLRGGQLARESVLSSDWKALSISETSLTGTVASVQRNLVGVNNRLGYLNEGIFKRVLWQSELAAGDLAPPLLARSQEALKDAIREGISEAIAEQAKQVLGAVDVQRVATLSSLTAERIAAFDDIAAERKAVLEGVSQERLATLAALQDEQVRVLEAIQTERRAAFSSMDSVTQRSIDHAGRVVGRLLLWTVVATVGLAIFVGFGAVWVARSVRTGGGKVSGVRAT
jgi:hypothetical protein